MTIRMELQRELLRRNTRNQICRNPLQCDSHDEKAGLTTSYMVGNDRLGEPS